MHEQLSAAVSDFWCLQSSGRQDAGAVSRSLEGQLACHQQCGEVGIGRHYDRHELAGMRNQDTALLGLHLFWL